MEDKYITLLDENENELLAEVIFTFENEGENYVILTLVGEYSDDEDEEVIAYKYEELEDGSIGNLIEIQDNAKKEWDMVEEMIETFSATNFEMSDNEEL